MSLVTIRRDLDIAVEFQQLQGSLTDGAEASDAVVGVGSGDATAIFSDNFSSGDYSHAENGWSWDPSVNVSVTAAPDGNGNAAQFRHKAKPDVSGSEGDSTAELGIIIPGTSYRELWFEYDIWFPDGTEPSGTAAYVHRDSVSVDNNKLWKIAEHDQGASVSFLLECRPSENSGAITKARPMWGNPDDGTASNDWGDIGNPDIVLESDRGAWMRWRFHLKISDQGQANGLWWMDSDGVVKVNQTIDNEPSVYAEAWLSQGYLMGWHNSGYTDETHIWIKNVAFYDSDPGWG